MPFINNIATKTNQTITHIINRFGHKTLHIALVAAMMRSMSPMPGYSMIMPRTIQKITATKEAVVLSFNDKKLFHTYAF